MRCAYCKEKVEDHEIKIVETNDEAREGDDNWRPYNVHDNCYDILHADLVKLLDLGD